MNKEDFKSLDEALALLHDFISNGGAKAEHYAILNSAEDVLKGYLSTGGER
jgi:hypothetical protein